MTWLDDRIAQSVKRKQDNKLILDWAESVFNALWEEITRIVEEAKSKGFQLSTNGSPDQRAVIFKENRLLITLERDAGTILANGPGFNLQLSFSVDKDDVVRLKYAEKFLPLKEAAQSILDPFLFPDLQKE
jgi:hypothetical protein